jgi:hypothetical protein
MKTASVAWGIAHHGRLFVYMEISQESCRMIRNHSTGSAWWRLIHICQVPDDCIDPRRRALFIGRETMRELIEELRRQKS